MSSTVYQNLPGTAKFRHRDSGAQSKSQPDLPDRPAFPLDGTPTIASLQRIPHRDHPAELEMLN